MKTHLTSIAEHSDWLNAFKLKDTECWRTHRKRVNFGKHPLALWMFVPCGEDGNILEEPKYYGKKYTDDIPEKELILHEEFVQAKERCLFEGFEIESETEFIIWLTIKKFNSDNGDFILQYAKKSKSFHYSLLKFETIEDLVKYNLELTPTALKQLY